MFLSGREAAAVIESVAIVCAIFNSVYFLGRAADRRERPGRRVAAGVLSVVSLGTFAEAAALLALLLGGRGWVAPWWLVLGAGAGVSG